MLSLRGRMRSWWYGEQNGGHSITSDSASSKASQPTTEVSVPHPYDLNESSLPWWIMVLLAPLLIVHIPLVLLRILVITVTLPLFVVVCCIFERSTTIVNLLLPMLARLLLVGFGVWPGLIRIKGKPSRTTAPIYLHVPHVGLLDAWLWVFLGPARPLMMEAYTKIPVVASVFRAMRGIAVPKRTDGASWMAGKDGGNSNLDSADRAKMAAENTKLAIAKHQETFDIDGPLSAPLLVCPEGHTHSGAAILQFYPGAFEAGSAVQPVAVTYPYKYFNAAAFISTLPSHLLRIMISPWISIHVEYLPVRHPTAEEAVDAKLYAANVRKEFAETMGLPLSPYGAWMLREEEKAKKQASREAKQAAKGKAASAKILV